MKRLWGTLAAMGMTGCATLTNDAMTPVAISFGDGSRGECFLENKRGNWSADIPGTVSVRRSDDALRYLCKTADGREAGGVIASTMGAKIVASAVFIDLGITDAITDKHRDYPPSFVIPIEPKPESAPRSAGGDAGATDVYTTLRELDALRADGILTEAEFEAEKKKLLDSR